MIVDFYYTLTRGEIDFELVVEYTATRHSDDVDIDINNVTLDGAAFETSHIEDIDILQACCERMDEDFEDYAASEGDARYDAIKHDF
jgi:hypothetical protein